jgi:2-phospho-L-lactate guanylyltransferase
MNAPIDCNNDSITVVIAVRGGAEAKSRLRPVLGRAGCSALVAAMLGDMVAALREAPRVGRIILVTPTPALADGLNVEILDEDGQAGINAAFALACQTVTGCGLFLPGDLPELDGRAVDALLHGFQLDTVRLVPSVTDGGTGALLAHAAPPELFAFGPNSLERHQAAAHALGLTPVITESVPFAHDLDCPEQLPRAARNGGPRTRALLAELLPERQAA